jgi:hypothetical protein
VSKNLGMFLLFFIVSVTLSCATCLLNSEVFMMLVSRIFFTLLLISQCAHGGYHRPSYSRHYYQDSTIETVGKVAIGVGCLAAVGYGIYKFWDWFFAPSDEKVLQKGIDALQEAHTHYDDIVGFMEYHYSAIPDTMRDQKRLIQSVNELLLYDFAISHKKDMTINSVLIHMTSTISTLQSAHKNLADRIKKLRKKNSNPIMVSNMEQIDQEIIGLLCKLEFICEYFTHHRNYYSLFELETRIMRTYEFELNAINQNSNYLHEVIRASVMTRQGSARNGYPYIFYVDCVQTDCNALAREMKSLSYNYANRLGAASVLMQHIQMIHTMLVAEDAYHQELRDYKKEQLERQRLEAERAQAAAATAQAAALAQQTREMQRQNYLHAEQNRLNAERNAIMATQTIVNAINPQPQVNVYV